MNTKSKQKPKKVSIDLNYYQNVVDTQRDPYILKMELQDLINEIKALKIKGIDRL